MFDLFRSREKTVRYLLTAVLSLVALSMVITLIPGYGGGGMGSNPNDPVIAEIGDEKLTTSEVRRAMQREMQNKSFPPEMAQFYIPIFVQNMVSERAMSYLARQMGFDLSEAELANAIRSVLPQLFEGGKFVGRDVYAQYLAQQNMTIPQFEDAVRKQMLLSRLQTLVLEGIVVSPAEVEEEFRRKEEKIKLEYVVLNPEKLRSQVSVSPDDVKKAYDQFKATYKIPEKRDYLLYAIDEAKLSAALAPSEADLRRAYDSQRDRYRTPERVRARHILLKTTEKSAEEVAKLQKRAGDLLKQARGGADFAELAKKNSEDTISAAKGGDLEWVTRGQTVPEFEKAAFGLKPGEISDVVKTTYGFHIIKVEAKEVDRVQPFDEVKSEIARELTQRAVYDRMQTLADQIRAALVRSPEEADKIASANGISAIRVEKAGAGDPIQEVGVAKEFQDAAAGLSKGGVTPVVALPDNKLVVARVTEIYPERQAEFAEVQERAREQAIGLKVQELMQKKIAEGTEKLKTSSDLAQLAKALGGELKTTGVFGRDGAAEGIGAASQVEEGFSKNVGQTFGPLQISGSTFFAKVIEKVPADLTQLAAQRDSIVQSIKGRRARERQELLADGIVNKLIKDKKVKVNDDAVKRLISSYRS